MHAPCSRVLPALSLLLLAACASEPPREGAVGLTVAYAGFRPRCLRVSASDAAGAGAPTRTLELEGKGEPSGGALKVALFRDPSWGTALQVRAEAYERAGCEGSAVASTDGTVTVVEGEVTQLQLSLSAQDADADGWVDAAGGGLDCQDGAAEIGPEAAERCDGVDNNCDGAKDEGFSVGASCTTASSCQSAWSCSADGERACLETQGRWKPDVDSDGFGSSTAPSKDACMQPAGHVANATDCDDTRNTTNPDANERCDGRDNDCDGAKDEGFDVGAACKGPVAGGTSCDGTRVCQSETATTCNAPEPTLLYRDADGDGQGDRNAAAVGFCPGQSTQGFATNKTDCDDADASTKLGAAERCGGDNKDNNCNGQDDTTEYALGETCTTYPSATHCAGERACASDGTVACVGTVAKTLTYPDEDRDTHGRAGATGTLACVSPDRVASSDDCDDGDRFVWPAAAELCDGKDNDCNSATPSDPSCKDVTAAWTPMGSGGSEDWYAVHLFGDGGVAIAGQLNDVRMRPSKDAPFRAPEQTCTGSWQGVWAEPDGERIFLVGEGTLGVYRPGTQTCASGNWAHATTADGSYLRSVVGLGSGVGVELHAVGEQMNFDDNNNSLGGRSVIWDGRESALPASSRKNHSFVLADVHGSSREALFAVGGDWNDARIYRFVQDANGAWAWTYQQDIGSRMLRAVWVVSPRLVFAGGEDNTLFRYDGTGWQSITGPGAGDIVSLVAFGSTSVYALTFTAGADPATDSSRVYRYDGSTWTKVGATFSGTMLRDLAATSPEDLWVVGRDGVVAHWP